MIEGFSDSAATVPVAVALAAPEIAEDFPANSDLAKNRISFDGGANLAYNVLPIAKIKYRLLMESKSVIAYVCPLVYLLLTRVVSKNFLVFMFEYELAARSFIVQQFGNA